MKKLADTLNPKCEKITQEAYDYLFRVNGCMIVLDSYISCSINFE